MCDDFDPAALGLEKLNWDSQQGRVLAMSGHNKKKSIGPILFLHVSWEKFDIIKFEFKPV